MLIFDLLLGILIWCLAIFRKVTTACSEHSVLNATETLQYFVSHRDYGIADYSNNVLKCWEIVTWNHSHVIELMIDSFHLEHGGDECTFDSVTVYDGSRENKDSMIGKYCGDKTPDAQYSSHKAMYIKFQSDSSVTDTGFKFGYRSINESLVPHKNGRLSTSVIVGIVFAALAFFIIALIVAVVCAKSKKNKVQQSSHNNRGINTCRTNSRVSTVTISYGYRHDPHLVQFSPPPSYDDVILQTQTHIRQGSSQLSRQQPIFSNSMPRRSTLTSTCLHGGLERANNNTSSAYRRSLSYQLESVSYSREMDIDDDPISPPPPYSVIVENQ